MDLVGLDVDLAVSKSVYAQTFHDPRFAPNVIQQGLVDAGRLGRKTGRGFFGYGHDGPASDEEASEEMVSSIGVTFTDAAPAVTARGDLTHAAGLLDRLTAAGVEVVRVAADEDLGHLRVGPAVLVPTDGRTATEIAASGVFGTHEVAVLDLVADWSDVSRVALANAAQSGRNTAALFAGILQQAGVSGVSIVADTPGLVLMRIVAQLASVAADAVLLGVAEPADVDTAMRLGTNYPRGPLEWADAVGPAILVDVLDHMRSFYGEDRYRVSALLRRAALAGTMTREGGGRDRGVRL
jgi:3-hydroxybutyryl-CoA dehydrogenase